MESLGTEDIRLHIHGPIATTTPPLSALQPAPHQHPCLHHSQPLERGSLALNALENFPSTDSTSFLSAAAGPSLLLPVQQPPASSSTVYM